jgi:hypothetical protein
MSCRKAADTDSAFRHFDTGMTTTAVAVSTTNERWRTSESYIFLCVISRNGCYPDSVAVTGFVASRLKRSVQCNGAQISSSFGEK